MLARRLVAFVIDFCVPVPVAFASMFILAVGIVTFGLGLLFYGLLRPAAVIWAVAYYGVTLGSPGSATIGMRVMDIELRTWYGAPAISCLAPSTLSCSGFRYRRFPFILLVGLFNDRHRLLHDILVGVVIINNESGQHGEVGGKCAGQRNPLIIGR